MAIDVFNFWTTSCTCRACFSLCWSIRPSILSSDFNLFDYVAYKEQGIMLLPMVLALDVFVKKNRFKKRSRDWSSESQLFFSGLKVCPRNAKIYYNIAKRESERSHPDMNTVIRFYKESLHLWPNYGHAMNNLDEMKEFIEAEDICLKALRFFPESPDLKFHLANIYGKTEKYDLAERCIVPSCRTIGIGIQ
ncbi:TMTC [Lepeophtheirus salmonis]|uniref:TMTC n=1 Tax=Lepeophtheirus salmonis TaxID=72036 RepID=A0A7R8CWB8_LEPSM|nr:TMTC [Lepeophtheirus salmonis]CAF2952166.1 TMTC [Lepeophtheirus salmonis]